MRIICRLLTGLFLALGLQSASAFSLLGPFEPWMTTNLGFNSLFLGVVDVGGPKDISEGYRWNIPVITYGYDQSFLDYFGSNGVAAVESAIQVFNDLPVATETNLNSFSLNTTRINYHAAQLGLSDLKSSALALILEQLGLTSPTRFVYVLRDFTDINNPTVIMRNFDPVTLAPSFYVNGTGYSYFVYTNGQISFCNIVPIDPGSQFPSFSAVADYTFNSDNPGAFYAGLTRDDVGGLYYLYGTNNFALENLIPGIHGTGTNASNFVNLAIRPGVGNITFQRLTNDQCGGFVPLTICYQDAYLTNNTLQHQMLKRDVKQPDVLFTAAHLGFYQYSRTGTSNWVNNGAPLQNGPGVIQPPVAINFARVGPIFSPVDGMYSGPADFYAGPSGWASFDGSTNAPIVYPADSSNNNSTAVNLELSEPPYAPIGPAFATTWMLAGQHDKVFLLQTSTNLSTWSTITTVTNTGQDVGYFDHVLPSTPQRFFRTVPQ
ncbi:MAG TPA: hypothetical protein VN048_00545 [Verrucomicrobiae bacterium]|jgi:hypothetical protein|nr:hypothetical protein [Verrucomicrobiae bacterium]